jgi:hypothetical protein
MCVENRGYVGSLWMGKVYRVVKPVKRDGPGGLRVIDEEGEDYLYSSNLFGPVELPSRGRRALVTA